MKSKLDLAELFEFSSLDKDTSGVPCAWRNKYECKCEEAVQVKWELDWSCQCNDRCPDCDTENQPVESIWIGPESDSLRSMWDSLPDVPEALPAPVQERSRRIRLTHSEIAVLISCLSRETAQFGIDLRARLVEDFMETEDVELNKVKDAYRAAVERNAGDLEVDDDAEVSLGDDEGAYVMAWKWVEAVDAGVCITCGETGADDGEGYAGECGSCADKSFNDEEDDE